MVSYFKNNTIRGLTLIQIPILIGAMSFTFIKPINDMIVEARMEINLGETPQTLKKGSEYDLPYSISYEHKTPAVGVKVRLTAPGILNEKLEERFNAITKSARKSGEFKIKIPDDIPEGHYAFELTTLFDASRAISFPTIKKRGFHIKTTSFEFSIK